MEMKKAGNIRILVRLALTLLLFLCNSLLYAQNSYSIKNGKMFIQLYKSSSEKELDKFIADYELRDLELKELFKPGYSNALVKEGWKVEVNNSSFIILSKKLEGLDEVASAPNRIIFNDPVNHLFPTSPAGVRYGMNKFKTAVFPVNNNTVTFTLKGFPEAKKVMLAGSFNNWDAGSISMTLTTDGWQAKVKLTPGKWWYKFIVDGNWITDNDNLLKENDGKGNINSVYYVTNTHFICNGRTNAKKVYLAGSFNNWKPNELLMTRIATGWILALYLPEGTHTYKFVADGNWITDEGVSEKLPDGHGAYNSVLKIGKRHLFKLNGFQGAKEVRLAGSFNGWKEDELYMIKTASGWQLSYTLGAGNYEYKFIVDGKWITDPDNAFSSVASGNSFLIIQPNYTFHLKGYNEARSVFLAGDFNNWDPNAYSMKKQGNEWIFTVHLWPGKHLYKYLVDGKWIVDPGNKLWEQNEYGSGNSVLWMEQGQR